MTEVVLQNSCGIFLPNFIHQDLTDFGLESIIDFELYINCTLAVHTCISCLDVVVNTQTVDYKENMNVRSILSTILHGAQPKSRPNKNLVSSSTNTQNYLG